MLLNAARDRLKKDVLLLVALSDHTLDESPTRTLYSLYSIEWENQHLKV
jgi:hypothetical protein